MLEKFKKKLGIEGQVKEVEASAELSDVQAQLAEALSQVETANAMIAEMTAAHAEALSAVERELEAAKAALDALKAEKAEMIAKAEAAKQKARKEKVVAIIGTEKADALMAATAHLDDAAFEAVVSALAVSVEVEASSDMFKEVGVDAEVDTAKAVQESEEMRLIKQKYGVQK